MGVTVLSNSKVKVKVEHITDRQMPSRGGWQYALFGSGVIGYLEK